MDIYLFVEPYWHGAFQTQVPSNKSQGLFKQWYTQELVGYYQLEWLEYIFMGP